MSKDRPLTQQQFVARPVRLLRALLRPYQSSLAAFPLQPVVSFPPWGPPPFSLPSFRLYALSVSLPFSLVPFFLLLSALSFWPWFFLASFLLFFRMFPLFLLFFPHLV